MRVCPEYSLYFAVLRIKYIWICLMECYLFLFQQVESRSQKFPQVRLIKLTRSSVTSKTNWEQNQNDASHIKLYLRASAQPHLFSQTHEEIKLLHIETENQLTWCMSVHVWNSCESTWPLNNVSGDIRTGDK